MSAAGGSQSWVELFPDEDYRFNFGIKPGDAAAFFVSTPDHERLISERRRYLDSEPHRYAALLPEGGPLLREAIALARQWKTLPPNSPLDSEAGCETVLSTDPLNRPAGTLSPSEGQRRTSARVDCFPLCLALGRAWESDFLLLKPAADGRFHLLGAVVCFPSSWRLTEKIGRPLDVIHAPVPGLEESLGRTIHSFLAKIRPGPAWCRSNWGISRSSELNYHPDLSQPRLTPPLRADEVFVRIENQALVALPESGCVLFGIRLLILPLAEVRQSEPARRGLLRALRTMPEPVAEYKGVAAARAEIMTMLAD